MHRYKLHDNVYLIAKSNWINVERDGKIVGGFSPFTNRPVYISLTSNKPKNIHEAESRVGFDVIKLYPEDIRMIAIEMGMFKKDEKEKREAIKDMEYLFYDVAFNGMDEFVYTFKVPLTKKEIECLKGIIYYDADVDDYVLPNTGGAISKLVECSDRFRDVYAFMLYNGYIALRLHAEDMLYYVRYYSMKDCIVDYFAGHEEAIQRAKEKYGFTGNTELLEKSTSFSGYNLGRYEVENKGKLHMLVYSYALPPDDFAIEVIITKCKITKENANIFAKIASVKEDMEFYRSILERVE